MREERQEFDMNKKIWNILLSNRKFFYHLLKEYEYKDDIFGEALLVAYQKLESIFTREIEDYNTMLVIRWSVARALNNWNGATTARLRVPPHFSDNFTSILWFLGQHGNTIESRKLLRKTFSSYASLDDVTTALVLNCVFATPDKRYAGVLDTPIYDRISDGWLQYSVEEPSYELKSFFELVRPALEELRNSDDIYILGRRLGLEKELSPFSEELNMLVELVESAKKKTKTEVDEEEDSIGEGVFLRVIGEELGVTRETIRTRVLRTLHHIRQYMIDKEIDYPSV